MGASESLAETDSSEEPDAYGTTLQTDNSAGLRGYEVLQRYCCRELHRPSTANVGGAPYILKNRRPGHSETRCPSSSRL